MFASQTFFYVPTDRQINVFLTEEDARANVDVIGLFTQLENVSTDYTLDVHGRELKLDLEFPDGDPRLPKDTAVPEWTAAIIEHIAPYLKDGVITARATFGEITVDDRGEGKWFMARGNESVTLNNENHIPDADCQYWVGYSSSCATCGDTPDFEFVGVDSSVLNVPEGVSLGEHLTPFIEAMEAQQRAKAHKSMERRGFGSLFHRLGMSDRMERPADNCRTVVHHAVAGEGAIAGGEGPDEVGRIVIAGETVLVLYPTYCVAFGKRSTSGDDNEIDTAPGLLKSVSREIQQLTRIAIVDITPDTFNVAMMRDVMWRAMSGNYQNNGNVDHQLYHTARSVATPGKLNWWLRALVNAWFMHTSYPSYHVKEVIASQIRELATFMELEEYISAELIQRMAVVVDYWADNKDKQG